MKKQLSAVTATVLLVPLSISACVPVYASGSVLPSNIMDLPHRNGQDVSARLLFIGNTSNTSQAFGEIRKDGFKAKFGLLGFKVFLADHLVVQVTDDADKVATLLSLTSGGLAFQLAAAIAAASAILRASNEIGGHKGVTVARLWALPITAPIPGDVYDQLP